MEQKITFVKKYWWIDDEENIFLKLIPKDPWEFWCKTTQNYPPLKKGLVIIF